MNQNSRILRPSDDQLIGFRLIENGFALGGANPYSEPDLPGYNSMPRNNYVNWHIGEIHIISPSLKPNLKRNKLEESEDARQFVERLRYFYRSVEYSDRVLSKRRDLAESYQTSKGWIENKLALPQLDLNLDDQSRVAKLRRELRDQDSRARTRSRSSERGSEDVDALKQVSNARHQLLGLVEQVIQRHFSETGGAHQGGVPLGAPSSQQQPPVQNATNHNPPPSPPQPITQTQSPTSPSPVTSTAPGTSNSWSTAQAGSDLASAVFSTGSGGTTDSVATQDSNEATERTTAGFADDSVDDAQELLVSEAEILISIAEEVLDSELHDNIALRDRILRKIRSRFMRVLQHE